MTSLSFFLFFTIIGASVSQLLRQLPPDASAQATLLAGHNMYRKMAPAANMRHMRWNPRLAQTAQAHANRCMFGHSSQSVRGPTGENIWTHGFINFTDVTFRWWDEVNSCPCPSPPGFSHCCGHYSQLVWASTNELGCGVSECDHLVDWPGRGRQFVAVCHYSPRGNIMYSAHGRVWPRKAFLMGPACSKCGGGSDCVDGLCL